jgi:hypothetical protein
VLNRLFNIKINGFSLLIALVAWMLVFLWRDSCQLGWRYLLFLQPLASIGLAGLFYVAARKVSSERQADLRLIPFAVAGLLLPFGIGWIERTLDIGSPWEVLSMIVFANWTLLMAMLSRFERYQNLTAIFAGTATFVVISMIEGWRYSLLGGAYGLLVLWWSMTTYWEKLEQKFADDQRSERIIRSSAFLAVVVGMVLISGLLLMFVSTGTLDSRGFSWFSGGERFSDNFARDGVGQGDGIRAATQNPMTFGAVDSEIFLESQQPTLYDVNSDVYGPPHKVRRQTRAIGIEAELMKENHGRAAHNQQASGEFSVARKPRPRADQATADRLSTALFHVKGTAPMWLALETYNHFEDGTWFQVDPDPAEDSRWQKRLTDNLVHRNVSLEPQWDKPWMNVRNLADSPFFGGWEYSALKIVNFRSLRIPTPACLAQFYIDRIDRQDFFLVGSDDVPQLNSEGSHIPADTVIHFLASRMNLYQAQVDSAKLQRDLNFRLRDLAVYLDSDFVSERVADKARDWTAGSQTAWEKIEQINARLRREFRHDPDAVLPEGETDAGVYLLERGAGTDYMFATTAASMLRVVGVPCRVVNGFWVDPESYDRKTGHSSVLAKDLHVWVEVSLDGKQWIPVEPTPSYPQPRYELTWPQQVHLACLSAYRWILRNPVLTLLLIAALSILIWNYKWIVHGYQILRWKTLIMLNPRVVVGQSAKLIDQRARLIGLPRPASVSQAQFCRRLIQLMANGKTEFDCIDRFIAALNCELYHPRPAPVSTQTARTILEDCRMVIRQLRFRDLQRLKSTQGTLKHV